jgi:hypothetical protein
LIIISIIIIIIIIIGKEGVRLVTEEEKIAIKTFLLHFSFEETNKKVALQLAILTAKVIKISKISKKI